MNKESAIFEMVQNGKKIRRTHWCPTDYIHFKNGYFVNQNGKKDINSYSNDDTWELLGPTKVKMWQWVVEYENGLIDFTVFGVDEEDALKKDKEHWSIPPKRVIQRADWTEIEVRL